MNLRKQWRWMRGEQQRGRPTRDGSVGDVEREMAVMHWEKPHFGTLKLNCDAAWRRNSKVGGVGAS